MSIFESGARKVRTGAEKAMKFDRKLVELTLNSFSADKALQKEKKCLIATCNTNDRPCFFQRVCSSHDMHLHARLRPVWGQRNHLCISERQLFNTITHRRPALLRGLPRVTHTSGISFQEHHCKVVLLIFRATLDIRRLFFTYRQPSGIAQHGHETGQIWSSEVMRDEIER